jgi:uncharacterized membrane protein
MQIEAKRPGESSMAASPSSLSRSFRQMDCLIAGSRPYVTVTATTWIATALLIAALAPPRLIRHGQLLDAIAVQAFFSKLCHQRPDRMLYLLGAPTAVCARCLGIYAGAVLGGMIRVTRGVALRCLGVTLALNCLDVATESLGVHGNMPLSRLLIGAMLGLSTGLLLNSGGKHSDAGTCEERFFSSIRS